MSVTVSISNAELRKAMRKVSNWSEAKTRRVKAAVATTALNVDRKAKELAPVDTGRLRSSIHPEFHKGGLEANVTTNVEYAIHQEFGTVHMRAQPFMHPAAESERLAFAKRVKDALKAREQA